MKEWKHLTGADFKSMDPASTVVVVTCSPLEVHGPHLPTVTDIQEAESLIGRAVELLAPAHPELAFVQLPPIYASADVVPQIGSLSFRSSTIVAVLEDLGRSLGAQGFKHIWVSSFHGGPRHFVSIEKAAARCNRKYGTQMLSVFSLMLARLTGGSSDLADFFDGIEGISREDLVGDTHGGAIETSLMLHLLGDKVGAHSDLPRQIVKVEQRQGRPTLPELLRALKHKFKFYETKSYSGAPAAASPEVGAAMLERLSDAAAEALTEVLSGALPPAKWHSPLWKVRHLFTSQLVKWGFERWVDHRSPVW